MQTSPSTSVESQEVSTWNAWVSRANNAYIGFLALTLIATVLIVVFNNRLNRARDGAAAREKQASDEKVAALIKEAEVAKRERAETDLKAETARERASKAEEKTGEIERQNLQLRTDLETATAESRAKQAELATEQAKLSTEQRKTAEAQREAAEAQLALKKHLDEVAERQAFRVLSDEQKNQIRTVLRASPTGDVNLEYPASSVEAQSFALQIMKLLREAGWTINEPVAIILAGTPKGIIIVVGHADNPAAAALQRAFRSAGIDAVGELSPPLKDKIRLLVVHKP